MSELKQEKRFRSVSREARHRNAAITMVVTVGFVTLLLWTLVSEDRDLENYLWNYLAALAIFGIGCAIAFRIWSTETEEEEARKQARDSKIIEKASLALVFAFFAVWLWNGIRKALSGNFEVLLNLGTTIGAFVGILLAMFLIGLISESAWYKSLARGLVGLLKEIVGASFLGAFYFLIFYAIIKGIKAIWYM